MGYSEARGTLIYEKNLKSKISCQTPFKMLRSHQGIFKPFKVTRNRFQGIDSASRRAGTTTLFLLGS